jgi:LacI family transcriptional regulator
MATILDVAKLAGVSASTARRAVIEPHRVAPLTLNRVQKAIKQLDYELDHTAGALRRGRSLSIGLIVGDILEPHFSKLIRIIGHRARERVSSQRRAKKSQDV